MYYVERREGVIVGAYRNPQPGTAEEEIADDAPELLAFLTPTETDAQRVQRVAGAALVETLTRARTDPFAAAIVALFDVAFTLINDAREARGLMRLAEADLVPLAVQALIARQSAVEPEPPAPPPEP